MSEQQYRVTVARHDSVAVLKMNDADRANALAAAQVEALIDALESGPVLDADAIVIASSVRHFCAGADIRRLLESGSLLPGAARPADSPLNLFARLRRDARPVLIAVEGLAAGGGVELILSADMVVAGKGARFKLPELGLGVLPRTALARLGELIGRRRAMDLVLTRRSMDAAEALAFGLVNRVVDEGDALKEAVSIALAIVQAPPSAVAAAKRTLGRIPLGDERALDAVQNDLDPEEWAEGLTAFLEKRAPDFARFWSGARANRSEKP